MAQRFCPHCNPCSHDGDERCRAPDPIAAQPDDVEALIARLEDNVRTSVECVLALRERVERAEGEARLWLSEYNRLRQEIADATARCVAHLAERDALKAGCDVLRAELRSIGKALQDPQDNLTRTTAECIASLRAERDALRDDLHGLRRSTQERIDRLESEGDNVHKLNMALVAERDALRAELAEDAGGWARAERAEAERDALRADAERYRWLRAAQSQTARNWIVINNRNMYGEHELDAAIDVARKV